MMNIKPILKNEKGSAIIVALLVLVLLTIIGMSATSNSNTELQITTNSQLYKMAFYAAESGWQEMAVDIVQTNPTDPPPISRNLTADTRYQVTGVSNDPVYDDGWELQDYVQRPYTVTSNGTGPRSAASQIIVGLDKIEKYKQYE